MEKIKLDISNVCFIRKGKDEANGITDLFHALSNLYNALDECSVYFKQNTPNVILMKRKEELIVRIKTTDYQIFTCETSDSNKEIFEGIRRFIHFNKYTLTLKGRTGTILKIIRNKQNVSLTSNLIET